MDRLCIICDRESTTKLLKPRLQNSIIVTFYCACYTATATSLLLFTYLSTMFGCVLLTPFYMTPFYMTSFYMTPFYMTSFYMTPFYMTSFYMTPFYMTSFYMTPFLYDDDDETELQCSCWRANTGKASIHCLNDMYVHTVMYNMPTCIDLLKTSNHASVCLLLVP